VILVDSTTVARCLNVMSSFSNGEFEARALSTGVGHACGMIDAPAG
jgi:hypothetical protein